MARVKNPSGEQLEKKCLFSQTRRKNRLPKTVNRPKLELSPVERLAKTLFSPCCRSLAAPHLAPRDTLVSGTFGTLQNTARRSQSAVSERSGESAKR